MKKAYEKPTAVFMQLRPEERIAEDCGTVNGSEWTNCGDGIKDEGYGYGIGDGNNQHQDFS